MLGLILIPLIIGALISSIWGKGVAQGCFAFVGRFLMWGIVAVAVVLVPPFGIVLACGYGLFLLIRHGGRFVESYNDAGREIEHERQMAQRQKEREADLVRKEAEARIAADPTAPPLGAFGPPQHCRPRTNAVTSLPRPPKDAHYTATPVRDGDRIGYSVVEHQSGCRVFLTVGEYGRDWVGCAPPPRKPTETPKPAAPPTPTWTAPKQPRRP